MGLKLIGLKLLSAETEKVCLHYAKHKNEPYFRGLVEYMTSSVIIALAWRGSNAIALVRKNITDTSRSNKVGTIRGSYSMASCHFVEIDGIKLSAKNACHASENREEA